MALSSTELAVLRSKLEGIAPVDQENWPKIEAWIASAIPLIRTRLSEHLEDFRSACATPRWCSSPLFSSGGDPWSDAPARNNFAEAAARDRAANQRRAQQAKEKILAFLDGLIRLSGVAEAEAEHSSTKARIPSSLRIFISHAGGDAKIAKALIDLIEAGLEVPTGAIRCTSIDGYKLEGGDDVPEVLRQNLKECAVVVGVLTKTSVSSSYVLMELGAAWAFKKRAIPLIGPGAKLGDLPGPFKDIHALRIVHEPDMSGLIKTLANETGFDETNNLPKILATLKALREVLSTTTVTPGAARTPPFAADTVPAPSAATAPPAVMDDDEAMVHLETWLDQLADSVQSGHGKTPMILDPSDIARQAGVPEAKAPLITSVVAQNEHFGVTVTRLQSGKSRLDIGARKIRVVRNRRG